MQRPGGEALAFADQGPWGIARAAVKRSLGELELPAPLPAFLEEQLAATRTQVLDVRTEHLERLFFLGDNPDNRTLYVAANRVIANTARVGFGVRHVLGFTR